MDSEVEDSDATVAPDIEEPMSDGEKSPSFLNTLAVVFSNSSGGGGADEYSQPMSPELPLASGTKSLPPTTASVSTVEVCADSQDVATSSRSNGSSQRVDSSEPETVGTELEDVARLQATLLDSLQQAAHIKSSVEVKKLKDKATAIEFAMKEISIANQAERKRLATLHSSLSQQSQSQTGRVTDGSQSLRQELLSLAARQKTLLQCFKVQKEVMEKLDTLLVQCKDWKSDKTLTSAVHAAELEGKLGPGPAKRLSGPSAAIPNLLQHLKPQLLLQESQLKSSKFISHQSHRQLHPSSSTSQANAQTKTQHSQTTTNLANNNARRNDKDAAVQITPESSVTPSTLQQIPTTRTVPQHIPQPRPLLQPVANTTHSHIPPPTHTQTQLPLQTQPLLQTQVAPQVQSQALAVPVPLQTLIQHHFLEPGDDCISCVLMGCEFKCSLLESGSLYTPAGSHHFKSPNQWVSYCWSQLGQHKHSVKTKFAFKNVLYEGTPLISICEQFNRKQVSSYQQMSAHRKQSEMTARMESAQQGPMNSYIPGKTVSIQPANWPKVSQDTNTLLMTGQVLVVDGSSIVPLHLPEEYWGWSDVSLTPQLAQQLEKDLEW